MVTIFNFRGDGFDLDQLRSKKNLKKFFGIDKRSLNQDLDELEKIGIIRPHRYRKKFNHSEVKSILYHLDGVNVNKLLYGSSDN